jgi:hypothetical protein
LYQIFAKTTLKPGFYREGESGAIFPASAEKISYITHGDTEILIASQSIDPTRADVAVESVAG